MISFPVRRLLKGSLSSALVFCLLFSGSASAAGLPPPIDTAGLPADGGPDYNRLVFEKSPYLLLHAANPIDWFPWGEEAFEKARREDKPIFLSIGYSTCHWCHVMEDESFSDADVAAFLNRHFISIKVDREERPDIDQIYMAVSQIMTGRGGWPLTILMTPEKKPFFAATYIPREGRAGQGGIVDLLEQVAAVWRDRRGEISESADEIAAALTRAGGHRPGEMPGPEIFQTAYESMASRFDEEHGGFGEAPKFPRPHQYQFLLRYWSRRGEENARDMVRRSLAAMRRGGIFDQLGFGFHRYSTDRFFLVPHFEKMLYDQALLATAYLETWQATGDRLFADTAGEIFTYVLREMTSPEGGFYSAEDADSEGVEGKFYVWSRKEILDVLGTGEGASFADLFNVREDGNFREESTGEPTGLNILHLDGDPVRTPAVKKSRDLLFRHRRHRVPPLRDDKVLTAWNGLMIGALARGGALLGDSSYTAAAEKAADFLLDTMKDGEGRLLRRFRDGDAALPAYLDDYAFLVHGLIELYESTFHSHWLRAAVELNGDMLELFWDDSRGGLFFSGRGNERLLAPMKELYDGARPSGNAVALLNLLRLARLTGDSRLEEKAGELTRAFSGTISRTPQASTMMLTAMDFLFGPTKEIVIVGSPAAKDTKAMISFLRESFRPRQVVLQKPPGREGEEISGLAPYTELMNMREGKATAYVCENFTCQAPVTDLAGLKKAVQ